MRVLLFCSLVSVACAVPSNLRFRSQLAQQLAKPYLPLGENGNKHKPWSPEKVADWTAKCASPEVDDRSKLFTSIIKEELKPGSPFMKIFEEATGKKISLNNMYMQAGTGVYIYGCRPCAEQAKSESPFPFSTDVDFWLVPEGCKPGEGFADEYNDLVESDGFHAECDFKLKSNGRVLDRLEVKSHNDPRPSQNAVENKGDVVKKNDDHQKGAVTIWDRLKGNRGHDGKKLSTGPTSSFGVDAKAWLNHHETDAYTFSGATTSAEKGVKDPKGMVYLNLMLKTFLNPTKVHGVNVIPCNLLIAQKMKLATEGTQQKRIGGGFGKLNVGKHDGNLISIQLEGKQLEYVKNSFKAFKNNKKMTQDFADMFCLCKHKCSDAALCGTDVEPLRKAFASELRQMLEKATKHEDKAEVRTLSKKLRIPLNIVEQASGESLKTVQKGLENIEIARQHKAKKADINQRKASRKLSKDCEKANCARSNPACTTAEQCRGLQGKNRSEKCTFEAGIGCRAKVDTAKVEPSGALGPIAGVRSAKARAADISQRMAKNARQQKAKEANINQRNESRKLSKACEKANCARLNSACKTAKQCRGLQGKNRSEKCTFEAGIGCRKRLS